MSKQYLRRVSLIVGDASGKGLDLSDMHIVFTVWSATTQTPKHANIRVYNLSSETANRIKNEFTAVFLQAGYDGSYGQIFSGTMIQKRRGRENGTDTFIDIVAADNDSGYNWAVVNKTLAAGWTQTDYYKALIQTMAPYGVSAGYAPDFSPAQLPRGKVMYGMARDYMRELSGASGSHWTVESGKLHMVPVNGYLPGETVVLTSQSGMIGMPTQTIDGIVVRCLLNPNIRPGRLIQIDNASIQQAAFSASYTALNFFPSLDADGFYKVYSISQSGDTRGTSFYSEMICAAVNGTAPLGSTYTNAVIDGSD